MATEFSEIYDDFFSKINDDDLLSLVDEELNDFLKVYLKGAIAYFKKCRKNLKKVDFDIEVFEDDLDYEEIDILTDAMLIRWLKPSINKLDMFRTALGDRDFKMSSNANQLNALNEREKALREELKNKIMSYRYNDLGNIINSKK